MKSRLVQFSAVIVGDAHNPSILNPDFLAAQGIVPKSWGWSVAETITTPPLAVVQYDGGVRITVELGKIQITDTNVKEGPEQSRIIEIAAAYVKTLPHVRYTAVGNNFRSVIATTDPGLYLKERFLKDGPWSTTPENLDAIGIKLSYPLRPVGRLSLAIDAGEARISDGPESEPVIVCNANFSRESGDHPATEATIEHLRSASHDWQTYRHTLTTIFFKRDAQ